MKLDILLFPTSPNLPLSVKWIIGKRFLKLAQITAVSDLEDFTVFQNGQETTSAVDREIDGCCASPSSGRPEHVKKHGFDEEEQALTVGATGGDAEGA